MLWFEVFTGKVPFEDIPLTNLLLSILARVRPRLLDVDYCPQYLFALIEKCWATNVVERLQFLIINQMLVDCKAKVLKHPYGQEDDYYQNSHLVDVVNKDCIEYVLEDDNNPCVHELGVSCMIEINSTRLVCFVLVCN